MKAIKGFDANLQCRGFQFEVGKTYRHDGPVIACEGGFHAIPDDQHPLSVFSYYPPAGSRFSAVEVDGATAREGDKIAAEILTICEEIDLRELTLRAVKWVTDRAKPGGETASGYQGAATASGYQGAATASGDLGAATASGIHGCAMATGIHGCAMATGAGGMVCGDVDGVDLFAREIVWENEKYVRKSIACGTTGENGIKAGVWYRCVGGKLVGFDE